MATMAVALDRNLLLAYYSSRSGEHDIFPITLVAQISHLIETWLIARH